jgi:hypothetical protein
MKSYLSLILIYFISIVYQIPLSAQSNKNDDWTANRYAQQSILKKDYHAIGFSKSEFSTPWKSTSEFNYQNSLSTKVIDKIFKAPQSLLFGSGLTFEPMFYGKYIIPTFTYIYDGIDNDYESNQKWAYYGTWTNTLGYGGDGTIIINESIGSAVGYFPSSLYSLGINWEMIGYWVLPQRGVFGSSIQFKARISWLVLEFTERAQGMLFGFITQDQNSARIRSFGFSFITPYGISVGYKKSYVPGLIDVENDVHQLTIQLSIALL